MDILGIGPLEIALIILVAIIFLGPGDMVKTGRTLGRWLRKIAMSQEWRAIRMITHEISTTPARLIREAGIEELEQMNQEIASLDPRQPIGDESPGALGKADNFGAWTQPAPIKPGGNKTSTSPVDQSEPGDSPPEA